jgi:hypothetical protein
LACGTVWARLSKRGRAFDIVKATT